MRQLKPKSRSKWTSGYVTGLLYIMKFGADITNHSSLDRLKQKKFQKVVHYAVRFTQHFRHYLLGREFVVRTDHSSLQWLVNFKELQGQLARWLEVLNQYNMTIQHRAGKQHTNADALSRLETDKPCKEMSIFVKPENLPCGGCKHCSRVHEKWQDFTKINDVIPLTAVRVAKIDKIVQFLINDQVNGCMAKT